MPGHEGPTYSVSDAPKPGVLATAGWGGGIRLWDTKTGEQTAKLGEHANDAWGVSFSDDGQHLVTGGLDGVSRVWRRHDGEMVAALGGHTGPVHCVALGQQKPNRVATSGRDGRVLVWDLPN